MNGAPLDCAFVGPGDRLRGFSGDGAPEDRRALSDLALSPRDVSGYKMTIDRQQEAAKLARGASEGFVRAWNGGSGGQYLIAVTIQRFWRAAAARRFARREVRQAAGVTGRFPLPDVGDGVGLQVKKPAGMPDGRDGFGSVVVLPVRSLGVVMSHLGPSPQPPELLAGLAAAQHRRLLGK